MKGMAQSVNSAGGMINRQIIDAGPLDVLRSFQLAYACPDLNSPPRIFRLGSLELGSGRRSIDVSSQQKISFKNSMTSTLFIISSSRSNLYAANGEGVHTRWWSGIRYASQTHVSK